MIESWGRTGGIVNDLLVPRASPWTRTHVGIGTINAIVLQHTLSSTCKVLGSTE